MGILLAINQYLRKSKGQATVEFALVLPLLLLLLGGIIDFGYVFFQYSAIENLARDVARSASIEHSTGLTDGVIKGNAEASQPDNWNVVVNITPGSRTSGAAVTATVTCTPQTFFGAFYGAVIPNPLTARVTARQE